MDNNQKYIVCKNGNKYSQAYLTDLFRDLSPKDTNDILIKLGLEEYIDPDGGFTPNYSADIVSSSERFLAPLEKYNISLIGRAYNYFTELEDNTIKYIWTRDSKNSIEDSTWKKEGKNIVITELDLTNEIFISTVTFKLEIVIGDVSVFDYIEFSTVDTLTRAIISASHSSFTESFPTEIILTANEDFIKGKKFNWYLNNTLVSSAKVYRIASGLVSPGDVANIRLEVTDLKNKIYTSILSIPKVKNGIDGEPGVIGPPGEDGKTLYTHIKYADDEIGTNMSEYPISNGIEKPYIGIAQNQPTAVESTNPADYVWSKYIGSDGIPGVSGYLWIKYSLYPEGKDSQGRVSMQDDAYDEVNQKNMIYMGIAYNKQTKTESNIPEDYIWSKIKGEDGHTNYVLDLTNESHNIPTDSEGKILGPSSLTGASTEVFVYYGDEIVPSDSWSISLNSSHPGLKSSITKTANSRQINVTEYVTPNLVDYIDVTITVNNQNKKARFTVTKNKSGVAYSLLPSVNHIKVNSKGEISPSLISCKVLKNTGKDIIETTEALLTYKYSYTSGDGSPLIPGQNITVSNTNNPNYIQFLLFHPETNVLIDKEDIVFIRDGKDGNDGKPGEPGKDGSPGVPGATGAVVRMLAWEKDRTYYNNGQYKDYAYFNLRWYKLKTSTTSSVAGDSPVDNPTHWEVTNEVTGNIISDGGFIGGWILRNNRLFSQAGLVAGSDGSPLYSNVLLDGVMGEIVFADRRLVINKDGIIFNDSNKKPRMVFVWDDTNGVPILRFLNADGSLKWEAGQDGYKIITEGTQPISWSTTPTLMRRIDTLPNDPNVELRKDAPNSQHYIAADFIGRWTMAIDNNTPGGEEGEGTYLKPRNSFSFTNPFVDYNWNNGVGRAWYLNSKGDMLINKDVYQGYYKQRGGEVNVQDLPSPNVIEDGWYMVQGLTGFNMTSLSMRGDGRDGFFYFDATIFYYSNGAGNSGYADIEVHTSIAVN